MKNLCIFWNIIISVKTHLQNYKINYEIQLACNKCIHACRMIVLGIIQIFLVIFVFSLTNSKFFWDDLGLSKI